MECGLFDSLIDWVGEDETNPLASPVEITGIRIEQYEDEQALRPS